MDYNIVYQRIISCKIFIFIDITAKIKEVRNITIIENEDLDKALKYYRDYKIKFTDFLIVSQIPEGLTLVSFDQDSKKIKEVNCKSPAEILISINSS
ncbi:hypothetical protein A3D78_00030 [Candidatus Gottesmanbacteria bacterium RIFCSPHIGHO2_02_FULL_39_14]|uniref:PIN domain-containing protein n=2 Tax=Candidatus Gottesmaniibacteriota TaxID=1752720 RepID=A0A1F6A2J3_9BACT|nr:MAG: hypothetical protein A3D78_00030 [Candidatus Gottesmanbacteria bacterium RIFCSPHIGHO2_02_FULL_39_14]OGG31401.1 MAG: hypothetical protein A3I51_04995 [Candidatus Gottesmanbacteria bacterium RIFCSPLOWO2_02_FULL_38_8]